MKKYYQVFANSLNRRLAYRFDLFLNQLRSIVVFLILYFVWVNAASGRPFSGYTKIELITYVFGATLLNAVVFGMQSRYVAFEINTGELSAILLKPVNYFWYNFYRELSARVITVTLSLLELFILFLFLRFNIILQTDPKVLGIFSVSLALAIFLYNLMSFCISLIAFWSREAFGPRFLFDWMMQFASGQFFPLSILAKIYFYALSVLPFAFALYVPLEIYIGKISPSRSVIFLLGQVAWIGIFGTLARILWAKGLKHYTGEGI